MSKSKHKAIRLGNACITDRSYFPEDNIRGCESCRHFLKLVTEEPCFTCYNHHKWEKVKNGK